MRNLLLSVAIGDISGMPYEFNRTKDYDAIDLLHPQSDYTDDTVMTFACAEGLLNDMPEELIANAKSKLPKWMLDLNDEFDKYCAGIERN